MNPGINQTTFTIHFSESMFNLDEKKPFIQKAIVTKVYKRTLWRKILTFLGFKTKLFECETASFKEEDKQFLNRLF